MSYIIADGRPDRLAQQDRALVRELEEKGARLRVLEPASTGGPMGRMVLTVLGMVA